MKRALPITVKVALVLNGLALLGFIALFVVQPLFTDLDVRMNYTQLDREGVINEDALARFHPSYGFTSANHRNSVPRYIAGSALRAQTTNALLGGCLALLNISLITAWALTIKRATPAEPPSVT